MIVKRTFIRDKFIKKKIAGKSGWHTAIYTGWFLFGVIPLFIGRTKWYDSDAVL